MAVGALLAASIAPCKLNSGVCLLALTKFASYYASIAPRSNTVSTSQPPSRFLWLYNTVITDRSSHLIPTANLYTFIELQTLLTCLSCTSWHIFNENRQLLEDSIPWWSRAAAIVVCFGENHVIMWPFVISVTRGSTGLIRIRGYGFCEMSWQMLIQISSILTIWWNRCLYFEVPCYILLAPQVLDLSK